jgi:hypothetical protein
VIYLRRVLEELAWTQQLPALAHLLGRDDVPRKEHHLPRPLTPEQDQLIQQELLRRNDSVSNVLLLLRHTGMRIGECVDLSNVSISLSTVCARSALISGPSMCRLASSKRNAGFPWIPWFVNWSHGSVLCGRPPPLKPVVCYCLGLAAVAC